MSRVHRLCRQKDYTLIQVWEAANICHIGRRVLMSITHVPIIHKVYTNINLKINWNSTVVLMNSIEKYNGIHK